MSPQTKERTTVNVTRVENDSLGPVQVPADKLWGAQEEHALAGDPDQDLMRRFLSSGLL